MPLSAHVPFLQTQLVLFADLGGFADVLSQSTNEQNLSPFMLSLLSFHVDLDVKCTSAGTKLSSRIFFGINFAWCSSPMLISL